jgi:hypothetical protein
MADLNALIAQGAQFNMPDQLGQYAKMQQLQAGQQQMRTAALQEQSAGMQLQQLKEDRANMAKLSQKLSVKGLSPRQFFEALQTSGDSKNQQLGIEGIMKLDATEAFDRSQQTIPGQTPARVGGELGSGTAFMDNAFPGMPAPVNALASRAAAPAASTNALAPTPSAADPAVTAIEAEMRRIQPFVSSGATGAKEAMSRLEKRLEIASKRYTVGNTLMGQMGNVIGTAPAATAKTIGTVNPGDFTSASVANFSQSGNYGDLVLKPVDRVAKDDPKTTAAFSQVDNAGNVTFYNKFGESISTQKGAGKPSATFEKTTAQRGQLAKDLTAAIIELTDATKDGGLIDQSTGSGIGRAVDVANRFVGRATAGDIAIGKLQPVADLALKMIPRFEGPQSNADTTSYKQASGQLADPTLPTAIRKEAGKTVLRLMIARKDQFVSNDMAAETAAPQGTGGFKYLGTEGGK